jgi:predicted RecB family nuclease
MQIPSKDTAPIGVAIMTAPTSPTPDQDRPDPVRQPSLISREVLEGYLNCKYKGHLKLKGEQGTKSDYEAMMSEWRIEHKRRACDKLALHYREGEILREVEVSVAVLRKGVPLILDPFVRDDTLSLRWDGLKRIEGPSRLGSFHYIPILFNEGEKIRREQRWLLELCGLIIGDIQEKQPAHGIVILGDRLTAAKIELKAGPRQARRYLEEIKKLVEVGSPPDFLLNDHCQICEYRERCHLQAVKEDNLSLLRGMGEKTI